jgi:hypothetical protein
MVLRALHVYRCGKTVSGVRALGCLLVGSVVCVFQDLPPLLRKLLKRKREARKQPIRPFDPLKAGALYACSGHSTRLLGTRNALDYAGWPAMSKPTARRMAPRMDSNHE